MDTRTLAESYFTAVNKGGWEDFVAENFNYGMCDSQEIRQGRDVYLQGAGQFYALSQHLEVNLLYSSDSVVLAKASMTRPLIITPTNLSLSSTTARGAGES